MQYRTGTATIAFNSNAVTGVGTAWLANALPGDLFHLQGDQVIYQIATVVSDTSLTLTAPITSQPTGTGYLYAVVRDFTPSGIPFPNPGDVDVLLLLRRAMADIDEIFRQVAGATVTAFRLQNTSGSPKAAFSTLASPTGDSLDGNQTTNAFFEVYDDAGTRRFDVTVTGPTSFTVGTNVPNGGILRCFNREGAPNVPSTSWASITGKPALLTYKGALDATGADPAAPVIGDFWRISVAGDVAGVDVWVDDAVYWDGAAWRILRGVYSFRWENVQNKPALATYKGTFNALPGAFPAPGPFFDGDFWRITTTGTLPAPVGRAVAGDFLYYFGGSWALLPAVPHVTEVAIPPWQYVNNVSFSAVSGGKYRVATNTSAIACALPAAPEDGDEVVLLPATATLGLNPVTVNAAGGKTVDGGASYSFTQNWAELHLIYRAATTDWAVSLHSVGVAPLTNAAWTNLGAGGHTPAPNSKLRIATNLGAATVVVPTPAGFPTLADGDELTIIDRYGTFGTNAVVLTNAGGTSTILGGSTDVALDYNYAGATLVYDAATDNWGLK